MSKQIGRSVGFQGGPGMKVTVHYRLFDAEGELVEQSDGDDTLQWLLGYGEVPPKIEVALTGASVGDVRLVKLKASEAFGERDPEAVLEFAREEFPEQLAVGDELEAEDAAGRAVPLKIVDLDEERVVADTNHPLAAQTVGLELRLVAVQPASAEEIALASERLQQAVPAEEGSNLLPVAALLRHLPQGGNGGRSSAESARVQSGGSAPSAGDRSKPGNRGTS